MNANDSSSEEEDQNQFVERQDLDIEPEQFTQELDANQNNAHFFFQSGNGRSPVIERGCFFNQNGCFEVFRTDEERSNHAANCYFGLFQVCSSPTCRSKPFVMYDNPKALMSHAIANHRCTLSQPNVPENVKMTLPIKYLYQRGNVLRFLRKVNFRADRTELEIALLMIIMPNEGKEGDASVVITAVQIEPRWDQTSSSAHLIQLDVCMKGMDNKKIPLISDDETNEGETDQNLLQQHDNNAGDIDMQEASTNQNLALDSFNGFNSPREFYYKFKNGKNAIYSRNTIIAKGEKHAENDAVTINISAVVKVCRCSLTGSVAADLYPFASCWEDIRIPESLRMATLHNSLKAPHSAIKIVTPQLLNRKNLMIESAFEDLTMEAIILGILLSTIPSSPPPSPLTPLSCSSQSKPEPSINCNVLVLFPTKTSLEVASKQWLSLVKPIDFTCTNLIQSNETERQNHYFMGIGASQIIMTTLNTLSAIMLMDDPRSWALLTNDLQHIHLHTPSRLITTNAHRDVLRKFVTKLGRNKINGITKTVFDHEILNATRHLLLTELLVDGCHILSIGTDLSQLIYQFLTANTSLPVNDGKARQLCQLLNHEAHKNKRWLIFAEQENVEAVALALNSRFPKERITIFSSEETVINSPNFFEKFQKKSDGIILAPLSAPEFVEMYDVDRILLYDFPKAKVSILRICLTMKKYSNTRKPIMFWFQD